MNTKRFYWVISIFAIFSIVALVAGILPFFWPEMKGKDSTLVGTLQDSLEQCRKMKVQSDDTLATIMGKEDTIRSLRNQLASCEEKVTNLKGGKEPVHHTPQTNTNDSQRSTDNEDIERLETSLENITNLLEQCEANLENCRNKSGGSIRVLTLEGKDRGTLVRVLRSVNGIEVEGIRESDERLRTTLSELGFSNTNYCRLKENQMRRVEQKLKQKGYDIIIPLCN